MKQENDKPDAGGGTPGAGTQIQIPANALLDFISHQSTGALISVGVLMGTCELLKETVKKLKEENADCPLAETLEQALSGLAAAGMSVERLTKILSTVEKGICKAINATEDLEKPARPITPAAVEKLSDEKKDMRLSAVEWANRDPNPLAFGACQISPGLADAMQKAAEEMQKTAPGSTPEKKPDPSAIFKGRNGAKWNPDGTRDN